jgi:hypothetical protein
MPDTKEIFKKHLLAGVKSNAEDKSRILPDALKKTLDDAKVPQAYLLKVVVLLRKEMSEHKMDTEAWTQFIEKHKILFEQMNREAIEHKKDRESFRTELERRKLEKGEKGNPGNDAVVDEDRIAKKAAKLIRAPKDGKDADIEQVVALVLQQIPPPKKESEPINVTEITEIVINTIKDKKAKKLSIDDLDGVEPFIMRLRDSLKNTHPTGFMFNGKRYGFEELMHGGGSSKEGGSGFQIPTSGPVDGSNKTFIWATAPNVIVVDQGRAMQQTSSDGTVNWTGTTTTVLTNAPNNDIYATA